MTRQSRFLDKEYLLVYFIRYHQVYGHKVLKRIYPKGLGR